MLNPISIIMAITTGIDTKSGKLAATNTIIKPPSINTSPWAKLIRRNMPYTMVKPIEISAYCPPTDMPAKTYGITISKKLKRGPFQVSREEGEMRKVNAVVFSFSHFSLLASNLFIT
jgi:hypothetical protein